MTWRAEAPPPAPAPAPALGLGLGLGPGPCRAPRPRPRRAAARAWAAAQVDEFEEELQSKVYSAVSFEAGMKVEVRNVDEGFGNSWTGATVQKKKGAKFTVEYSAFVDDKGKKMTDLIERARLRPTQAAASSSWAPQARPRPRGACARARVRREKNGRLSLLRPHRPACADWRDRRGQRRRLLVGGARAGRQGQGRQGDVPRL